MAGPKYERIAPAPDLDTVISIVQAGVGEYLGRIGGSYVIGYPKAQGITDEIHVRKTPSGASSAEPVETSDGLLRG